MNRVIASPDHLLYSIENTSWIRSVPYYTKRIITNQMGISDNDKKLIGKTLNVSSRDKQAITGHKTFRLYSHPNASMTMARKPLYAESISGRVIDTRVPSRFVNGMRVARSAISEVKNSTVTVIGVSSTNGSGTLP